MIRFSEPLAYQHKNGQETDCQLDTFLDPEGQQAPLFLLRESPDNTGPKLDKDAIEQIGKDIASKADMPADELNLVTQDQQGNFTQHEFTEHTSVSRPMEADVPFQNRDAFQEAVPAQETTNTFMHSESIKAEEVQAMAGPEHNLDYPKSQAQEQDQAMRQDNLPTIDRGAIDPGELAAMQQQVEEQQRQQQTQQL